MVWETIIAVRIDSTQSTKIEALSDNAVSHGSGDVFTLGNELIDHIEKYLEQILQQGINVRYTLRTIANQATPAKGLDYMFTFHSEYIRHSLERQRALITDVDIASRSFIISEMLAITGVIVAVAAFTITDMRFQTLLK